MRNCPFWAKFQQLVAAEKQGINTVGVNNVKLQEIEDIEVAATPTWEARAKADLLL